MYPSQAKVDINKLFDYVKANDLSSIKSLVAQYKALNGQQWNYTDNIVILRVVRDAILSGYIDIVRYFIEEDGVSPNAHARITKGSSNVMPLTAFAAKAGNLAIVSLLVDAGANVHENDESIRIAVKRNKTEIALYLLEKGADPHGVVDRSCRETFLACAAANSNEELVDALIAKGAGMRISLHNSARKYQKMVKKYEKEISSQQHNRECYAAAMSKGQDYQYNAYRLIMCEEKIKKLDAMLQKVKVKHSQMTTLLNCRLDDEKQDMEATTSITKTHDTASYSEEEQSMSTQEEDDSTLLHKAVAQGNIDEVNRLLESGADPAITDNKGQTALHILMQKSDLQHYEEIFDRLLACNADIEARDKKGNTPLHLAAQIGDIIAINDLVSNGANLNTRNKYDQIPLHLAAKNGFFRAAITLLHLGSDRMSCDKKHNTAAKLARRYYARECRKRTFENRAELHEFKNIYGELIDELAQVKKCAGSENREPVSKNKKPVSALTAQEYTTFGIKKVRFASDQTSDHLVLRN